MTKTLYPHEQLINIFIKYPFLISIAIAIPLWVLGMSIIRYMFGYLTIPYSAYACCASPFILATIPMMVGFALILRGMEII